MKTILAGILAAASAVAAGVTILPPSDARVWQTVFESSQPLSWRWEGEAASATLTVSNLLTSGVETIPVPRSAGARNGACAIAYAAGAAPCGEALYDVVLRQLDAGDAVIDTQTARLAYLPEAFTLVKERHLGIAESARPVAYDSAWTNATENAAGASFTFTPREGSAATESLIGTSGYFAAGRRYGHLALDFDDLPTIWTADLAPRRGTALSIR